MVVENTVDVVAQLVLVVGLPLLIGLFYLEGLIIGKILQPPAVFVTVIAITTPSWPVLILLSGSCTLAVVVGQWTTYRSFGAQSTELIGVRRRVPYLGSLPENAVKRIGEDRFRFVDTLFERYGGAGIFISTFLPVVRGLLADPAGISSYSTRRFLAVSLVGNALYFPLLIAVAYGILQLLGIR